MRPSQVVIEAPTKDEIELSSQGSNKQQVSKQDVIREMTAESPNLNTGGTDCPET